MHARDEPVFFALARAEDARELWAKGVQAVLDQNCVKCHGPLKQKSGLALDTIEGVLKGSEDGAVVNATNPDESKLLAALTADSDPHMPPKKQLSPHDVAEIRTWIAALASTKPEAKREPIPDPAPPFVAADLRALAPVLLEAAQPARPRAG